MPNAAARISTPGIAEDSPATSWSRRPRRIGPPCGFPGCGAIWSTLWFALVVLAFGLMPGLSAPAVFGGMLALMLVLLFLMMRWGADARWTERHSFGLFFGTLTGAMIATFGGFQGAATIDIAFKVATNLIALGLIVLLGRNVPRAAR